MPSVLGMTEEEAIETLTENDLGFKIVGYEHNPKYPKDQVCKQSVEAEEVVKKGTTIQLTISQGSANVAVIDFTGYTRADIETWCEEIGVTPEFTYEINDDIEMDVVISWSPTAPAEVSAGDTMQFVLSQGTNELEEIPVPNWVGKTLVEARQEALKLGLVISVKESVYDDSGEYAAGTIMNQTPASGTLPKGSSITVTESLGLPMAVVEYVVGKTEEEAKAILEDLGFVVSVTKQASEEIEKGLVISQSVVADSKLAIGSTIELVVSSGSATVPVPNVLDLRRDKAEKELEDRGFEYVIEEEASTTVDAGYVIRQSIPGGTAVATDTVITIVISTGAPEYEVFIPAISNDMLDLSSATVVETSTITVKVYVTMADGSEITKQLASETYTSEWSFSETAITYSSEIASAEIEVTIDGVVVYTLTDLTISA